MTEAHAAWPIRSAWALLEHAPASADPLLQFALRWLRPLAQPFLPVELRHGLTVMAQDGWLPPERGWNLMASPLLGLARALSSSELIAARNARVSTAAHP